MGNRAVLDFGDAGLGIYLHWNGGPESIDAFLTATQERVGSVNLVGMVQTITNFMGYDGLSVYVGLVKDLDEDNYDNGTYTIVDGKIASRRHVPERVYGSRFDDEYRDGILALCRLQNKAVAPKDESDSRLFHICVDCFAQFEKMPEFADCPACVHGKTREHKGIHTIPEWREAVLLGDTKMGYVAWLDSNLAQDKRSEDK